MQSMELAYGLWLMEGNLLGCELRENTASNLGGGLFSGGDISLQNCLICENLPDWISGDWTDGTGNDFPVHCPNDCLGDFDSDYDVNVVDLLGLIGDWGACEIGYPCPGDFNDDGYVDVTDLLMVVGKWGPCE
jgi:predicted outer membrane repeat protein